MELGIKLGFVVWIVQTKPRIVETKPRIVRGKLFHEVFFSSFLVFIRILSFFFASFKIFFDYSVAFDYLCRIYLMMDTKTYISLAERFRHLAMTKASQLLQDADEVEDVAQEVLMKMWERHDSLENDAKRLNAYVDTLTRNICLDRKKVKRRHPIMRLLWRHDEEETDSEMQISSFDTPQRRIEEQEANDIYLKAMNRLPYHWRAILQMRSEEEMSYAEIASILGTTESSARGTLSKAKAKLLELIKKELR